MPTHNKILTILDYITTHNSTKTTQQMFHYFEQNDLLKQLVYAFPYMLKGYVLAFETLLSKAVVKQAYIERPELVDRDVIESMLGND